MSADRIALADDIDFYALALKSINAGAPGISVGIREHMARSIAMRCRDAVRAAALRQSPSQDAGERMREACLAVAPCAEPAAWSDDEHSADPRIEPVARAIAKDGLGVDWEDLPESYAHDFDRSDLRAYAKAAINGLSALPLASQEGSGC